MPGIQVPAPAATPRFTGFGCAARFNARVPLRAALRVIAFRLRANSRDQPAARRRRATV